MHCVFMSVCICLCNRVFVCVFVFFCVRESFCVYVWLCVYVFVILTMWFCMIVCDWVFKCVCLCLCHCICVCLCLILFSFHYVCLLYAFRNLYAFVIFCEHHFSCLCVYSFVYTNMYHFFPSWRFIVFLIVVVIVLYMAMFVFAFSIVCHYVPFVSQYIFYLMFCRCVCLYV